MEKLSKTAESVLNQYALRLRGEEISFYVHYWGVHADHRDNPVHKHSFYEICYVLKGEGEYSDNGTEYKLESGTIFISKPEVWHQIRSNTGLFLAYVACEVDESQSKSDAVKSFNMLKKTKQVLVTQSEDSAVAMLWRILIGISGRGKPPFIEAVTNLAHTLLVSFLPTFITSVPALQTDDEVKTPSVTLYRAQLFIRDNVAQPLLLEDVAGYLHISGRHLSRLFSSEMNVTFTHYIRLERIRQAKALLKTTTATIKEVASLTGFRSVHYFTRIFMVETGIPPGRFRNNL